MSGDRMKPARWGPWSSGWSKWARTAVCLLAAAACSAVALNQYEVYVQPSTRYCTSAVLNMPFPCDVAAAGVAFIFALAALALLVMGIRWAPRRTMEPDEARSGGDWA